MTPSFSQIYLIIWISNERKGPLCVCEMSNDKFIKLSLSVDGILLACNEKKLLLMVKDYLFTTFEEHESGCQYYRSQNL